MTKLYPQLSPVVTCCCRDGACLQVRHYGNRYVATYRKGNPTGSKPETTCSSNSSLGKLFTTTKVHFPLQIINMGTTASQLGKDLLSEYQVSAQNKVSKSKLNRDMEVDKKLLLFLRRNFAIIASRFMAKYNY